MKSGRRDEIVLEHHGHLGPGRAAPLLEVREDLPGIAFRQDAVGEHQQVAAELLDADDGERCAVSGRRFSPRPGY